MNKLVLSPHWLSKLSTYSKIIVGFSGGMDSTVLLHLLSSTDLKKKIKVVHIHHGLSVNANAWQEHCANICQSLNLELFVRKVQLTQNSNIEEQARIARYEVFKTFIETNDCLLLAHHGDDQAETLLLNLLRGSGIDGLAAMKELAPMGSGQKARPLLTFSRKDLEAYALDHKLQWIEDESNEEIKYSRNFLRHEILPLLTKKWPGGGENLRRTALHSQQALSNLYDLALLDNQEADLNKPNLAVCNLKKLSVDRITNVLRFWLKNNQVPLPSSKTFQRLIQEVLFARSDAQAQVAWGNYQVRLYQDELFIDKKEDLILPNIIPWNDFPEPLYLEHLQIKAKKSKQGLVVPEGSSLSIRFRKGGESFYWHGQRKSLKKLFQDWQIPPWKRIAVPLLYIEEELAAVLGYAVSDKFYAEADTTWEVEVLPVSANDNRTNLF